MEQIKLDIVPVGVAPVAHASQFDNSRQIRFNLFNQGTPYTLTGAETVTMVVNGEEENITNTSDNYVIWDVAEEDCEEVGVISCEIRIVLGSMLIGSKNFFLEVEMDPYDGKNIRIVTVGPADICAFETNLPEPLQSVTVDVVASQQSGTPTPSTPLPITGYSSANITRCGVNLWDEEWVNSTYDIDTTTGELVNTTLYYFRSKNFIKIAPNTAIYNKNGTVIGNYRFFFYDGSKNYISYSSVPANSVLTPPANAEYMLFRYSSSEGAVYNNDISINYPSTDTTYHAYNGQTYAISFGQTVYGGVLDVTRGKLHVTWRIFDFGDVNWYYWESRQCFFYGPSDKKNGLTNLKCDSYATFQNGDYNNLPNYEIVGNNVSEGIYVKNLNYTDAAAFKTAMSGVKCIYELATPFDIDLTPEVISAIVGTNNVFADCGQTTVKYLEVGG